MDHGQKSRLRLLVETYFDVQDQRIRSQHRLRNYSMHEGLIAVRGFLEADQLRQEGQAIYQKAIKKHKKELKFVAAVDHAEEMLGGDGWHDHVDKRMKSSEDYMKKLIQGEIDEYPLWNDWLVDVNGIGPVLCGGLMAWINIHKCKYASSLWKYCGITVVEIKQCSICGKEFSIDTKHKKCPDCDEDLKEVGRSARREKGKKIEYNPRAKTLVWKIGESFVKQTGAYRDLYEEMRAKVDDMPCTKIHKDTKGNIIPCYDAHRFAKAKRLTVKVFLSHVYKKWREAEGLPVYDLYVHGILKHDEATYIEPRSDKDLKVKKRRKRA